MSTERNAPPQISDHETIRMIGRGAYGEVWMARSVTGVLRAVKVVWRDDYDYVDSFEREFEAIKKFEPISRRHPGLVPVLQVGRVDAQGFYYYVMELADDFERGRNIDATTYKPHSLSLEMRRDRRVNIQRCVQIGINIAHGLHHLHEHKLIHRDVKPANLVFIDGVCRLADIGLVALMGQQSFVGTEGFVAPEGPGSAQSDIFSLGMVLYEASTGKDRLDFPDVPSSQELGEDLNAWKKLNSVMCHACAPRAEDRYATAAEMALDLKGEPLPSEHKRWHAWLTIVAALILATGLGMWFSPRARLDSANPAVSDKRPVAALRIESNPSGAHVFAGDRDLGITPLEINPDVGMPHLYQIRLEGHKMLELEHTCRPGKPERFQLQLERTRLPQTGEPWQNKLGMAFKATATGHRTVQPVEMRHFRRFIESTQRTFEGKLGQQIRPDVRDSYIVMVPYSDALVFRYWLTEMDRNSGFFSQEHYYEIEVVKEEAPVPNPKAASLPPASENPTVTSLKKPPSALTAEDDPNPQTGRVKRYKPIPIPESSSKNKLLAFHIKVMRYSYGSVSIRSKPDKINVFEKDRLLGQTPLELPRVRTGTLEYELRGEPPFTNKLLEAELKAGEHLELFTDMKQGSKVQFDQEWSDNTLNIKFVPLTKNILISAYEVRRRDYLAYTQATGARIPGSTDLETRVAHAVTNVNRQDARDFCTWLTNLERKQNVIGPQDIYRLPTDDEWSRAVGLPAERGAMPSEKNGRIQGVYPWGYQWPPPNHYDNFADEASTSAKEGEKYISGYEDKFSQIAPTSRLKADERGLYGMAGNASEWVDTDYDNKPRWNDRPPLATLRGGNWRSAEPAELLSSTRIGISPEVRRYFIGFRMVLERKNMPSVK
jgi:eukaryotic-like serine/threonine-protein kinase